VCSDIPKIASKAASHGGLIVEAGYKMELDTVAGTLVASQLGLIGMIRVRNRDHVAVLIVAGDHRINRRSTSLGWLGRSRRREGGAENDCGGKCNLRLAEHCHISSFRYGRCDRTQQQRAHSHLNYSQPPIVKALRLVTFS
jgi:hypothetical protein